MSGRIASHWRTPDTQPAGTWRDQAACVGYNPELWFPLGNAAAADIELAKAICDRCPVRARCEAEAMTEPRLDGIWGGLTEEERRHPESRRCACGTVLVGGPAKRYCSVACQHDALVGRPAGGALHRRYGQPLCEPCAAADRRYKRASKARVRGGQRAERRKAACGTPSGYVRHTRLREVVCGLCREAHRAAMRGYQRGYRARAGAA